MNKEKDSIFYDRLFKQDYWTGAPRKDQPWYGVWSALLDLVTTIQPSAVFDLGCGPGQLAYMLSQAELPDGFHYVGIDFSPVAIQKASDLVRDPRFEFHSGDLRKAECGACVTGGLFIMSEVLEHLEHDLRLLRQVPAGDPVLLALPTFEDPSHVRHFEKSSEAMERYAPYLEDMDLVEVDEKHFVICGRRRAVHRPEIPLTLCMVVWDEEVGIARAINSALDIVSDVVVYVDNKTKDRTAEIAEELGARVFGYEWHDDFSEARNLCAQEARSDWILVLDGHEYLLDPEAAGRVLTEEHSDASEIHFTVRMEKGLDYCNHRMYRKSAGGYRNKGHNLIVTDGRIAKRPEVVIVHDRYTGQSPESRQERNEQRDRHLLKVLTQAVLENPRDTRSMFYLGQQHFDSQRWAAAYYWYDRYNRTSKGNQWLEERFRAHYLAGRCAMALHDFEKASEHARMATALIPERGEGWALDGDVYYRRKEWRLALIHYQKAQRCPLPTNTALAVDPGLHEGGVKVLDQISMCLYRLGKFDLGAQACEILLARDDLQDSQRKRIRCNLDWHKRKLREQEQGVLEGAVN